MTLIPVEKHYTYSRCNVQCLEYDGEPGGHEILISWDGLRIARCAAVLKV
jgi:hypothetical protein